MYSLYAIEFFDVPDLNYAIVIATDNHGCFIYALNSGDHRSMSHQLPHYIVLLILVVDLN